MRVFLFSMVFAFVSCEATAQILHVDIDAPPGGNGLFWQTAYDDLQDALDHAAGDPSISEIWVAEGVYKPDRGSGDRTMSFQLITGVGLYGGFVGDEQNRDDRGPDAYETYLDGDLLDNDPNDLSIFDERFLDNSYHVVNATGVDATANLDGFRIIGGTASEHQLTTGSAVASSRFPVAQRSGSAGSWRT